jgi:AraC family transcriptional regulator, exoenzyme S synthesis regulatory protein ExsA
MLRSKTSLHFPMLNVYELLISHPEHFKQLKVKDLLFVHYHCPQDNEKLDIYTNYNFITYTISGERVIIRPGKTFSLTEGKCVFVKKGAYSQQRFHEADWCVLVFFMPDSYLRQFIKEYRTKLSSKTSTSQPLDVVLEVNVTDTTKAFFYSMLPYLTQQTPPSEDLLELKFRELLFNILSDSANTELLAYISSMEDQQKPPLPDIMEANYMFNLSLEEYSKISHRSLASFKREFSELFKTTPGKWLTQKRLHYAHLLLRTSKKHINEIAYESGFENSTHFSRLFKEKFGAAPLQFRKENLPLNA